MLGNDTPRRARMMATLMLATTFTVGALAGAAAERMLNAGEPRDVRRDPGGETRSRPPRRRALVLEPGVFDQLKATPEQRKTIQRLVSHRDSLVLAVWNEYEPRMKALNKELWAPYEPRMKAVFDDGRAKVREVLTLQQQATLDSLFKARHEQRNRQDRDNKDRERGPQGAPASPKSK